MASISFYYPDLSHEDVTKCTAFISDKCSEYFFCEYLDSTNTIVDHAISLFLLDEKLKTMLLQYCIRLESQLKKDFVEMAISANGDEEFWKKPAYYLPSARLQKPDGKKPDYKKVRASIYEWIRKSNLPTRPGSSAFRAICSCSMGTFIDLVKHIDIPCKQAFTDKYLNGLPKKDFKTLNSYLVCIKKIRNRCAHGSYVITKSFLDILNEHRFLLDEEHKPVNSDYNMLELLINFIFKNTSAKNEMKNRINYQLGKYSKILDRYSASLSLNKKSKSKMFDK